MPGRMKQGQSVFIPFKNGESIYDSQNKARMYMSEEKFRASFPGWRFGEVDLVEYAPKPRWIPVEERLPEEDGFYLAWGPTIYCDTKWYDQRNLAQYLWKHDVTHWMPLPEPPKEEV